MQNPLLPGTRAEHVEARVAGAVDRGAGQDKAVRPVAAGRVGPNAGSAASVPSVVNAPSAVGRNVRRDRAVALLAEKVPVAVVAAGAVSTADAAAVAGALSRAVLTTSSIRGASR